MKIGPKFYESLKGLDLADIEDLQQGPKGFQLEPGFHLVEGYESDEGVKVPPLVAVPVFALLCASDDDPVPQYRYLSPYELARGRVELADRIYAVRVDVADQDLSELVVGRRDDIEEELRDNAAGFARSLGSRLARFVLGAARGPFERLASYSSGLLGQLRGLFGS